MKLSSNKAIFTTGEYHSFASMHRGIAILKEIEQMVDEIAGSADHIIVARSFFTFSRRGESPRQFFPLFRRGTRQRPAGPLNRRHCHGSVRLHHAR